MSVVDGTFVEEDGFGVLPRPNPRRCSKPSKIVRRYTMTNRHNASVQLISWGAAVQAIKVPNKLGILGDVVLGFDTVDGYLENRYMGTVIGRTANGASRGKTGNGIYSLSVNGDGSLRDFNGENVAFDNVNWDSYVLKNHVIMSHVSPAGREGYPGSILTQIKYSWTDDNQLHINVRASATEPTPADITINCLMNLAGHGTGPNELKKHILSLNAGSWTVADVRDHLPTGAIYPVDHTVFDLRLPTRLSKRRLYLVPGGGYNQNLCVTSPSSWSSRFHARILHPDSGRTLEVYSNQPGLRFSTANDLPDPDIDSSPDFDSNHDRLNEDEGEKKREVRGKDGVLYRRHGGFVLSPQNYPNAVNFNHFPPCILYPGEVYRHDISYRFGLLSDRSLSNA